jgi:imidazoleglycerol-phosphate dehydratase
MARSSHVERQTTETNIKISLDLDGSGQSSIQSGIGFLDHMLTLFTKHGLFDLTVEAQGDLHIDQHHTVEDIGICFGQVLKQSLGDKKGISRYGSMTLPMEETLVTTAIDLSGRSYLIWNVVFTTDKIGTFDTELLEDFWQAVAANGLFNLHVNLHHGRNAHHIAEGIFKSVARALRNAVAIDPRVSGIPSTKGTL